MKFKIPFTFLGTKILKRRVKGLEFAKAREKRSFSALAEHLKNSDAEISKEEYIAICSKTFLIYFIAFLIIFSLVFFFLQIKFFYLYSLGIAILFSLFIFLMQLNYPKVYSLKKARDIEKNLIPALQDMHVQLNSGVAIFKIITNIANSDYGSVSEEFGKAAREINSGKPQAEALDELGNRTGSIYFRRVLWQISNGMRAGSSMSVVIKNSVDNLSKEQTIQIQSYGSKLNPLVVFYMLLTVILPALAIAFLTIISSILNLSSSTVKLMFIGIFFIVILMQVMFLGIIRTRRPSLL